MHHRVIAAVTGALLPLAAEAQASWLADPAIQQRLAAGEVVVHSSIDTRESRGRVSAAVRIHAQPEAIWNVMTDCERAPSFVPGLKRCRRVESAPNGAWELIEHEIKYSWLLPTIRFVFRRVSGDLKEEEGFWLLEATADGSATIIEYEVYVDPGFWVPQALIRRSLRKDLPVALTALRAQVETIGTAHH